MAVIFFTLDLANWCIYKKQTISHYYSHKQPWF